jgi:hypothetical protein
MIQFEITFVDPQEDPSFVAKKPLRCYSLFINHKSFTIDSDQREI